MKSDRSNDLGCQIAQLSLTNVRQAVGMRSVDNKGNILSCRLCHASFVAASFKAMLMALRRPSLTHLAFVLIYNNCVHQHTE